MHRPLLWLLAGSGLLKLVYVFALTDYRHYLFSDFWGYWSRALQRLGGDELASSQWTIGPPLPHILLSWYLRAVDFSGLSAWRLESILAANVALSTAGVALVYGIAAQTLQRQSWALAVAALYAFTFPLIYFNAFVMSEHPATLCMLAALWLVLQFPRNAWILLGAGALLGLAVAQRPAFGLFGIAFVAYLAAAERFERRAAVHAAARAALFSLGFALVVAGAVLETRRISSGQVVGLGAGGGFNFYFSQCRPHAVIARYKGEDYRFVAPAVADRPEQGTVRIDRPIHDQRFFTALGWQCLRDQPDVWGGAAERFRNLFFGPLLPSAPSALGFNLLLPAFRWFFLVCALVLPLAAFVPRASGVRTDALALLGGILGITAATLYIFTAEHRYLYPLAGPLYVVCAAVLLAATRERRRMVKAAMAWAGMLGAAWLAVAAVQAAQRPEMPPVSVTVYRYQIAYVPSAVPPVTRLTTFRAERLRYAGPDRLWPTRHGEAESFAVFSTCMEVRRAGLYEFLVVSQEGYALKVDDKLITGLRTPDMSIASGARRELVAGKHAYEIRVDRAVGLRATWRRLASAQDEWRPGIGLHYIGEAAEEAQFLPPERCPPAEQIYRR